MNEKKQRTFTIIEPVAMDCHGCHQFLSSIASSDPHMWGQGSQKEIIISLIIRQIIMTGFLIRLKIEKYPPVHHVVIVLL